MASLYFLFSVHLFTSLERYICTPYHSGEVYLHRSASLSVFTSLQYSTLLQQCAQGNLAEKSIVQTMAHLMVCLMVVDVEDAAADAVL